MAYFDCIVGGSGKGNTLVVTCADDLAGATITCTNGTKTYNKICPSTAPYEVTFYGLEAGTWTLSATVSGNTYTATVVITDCAALLGGFNWRTWVDTARFLDSTDYDSLSEVLADELALRELALEHACVDYMAGITTTNADVETIINTDLFAKWVNNSDYALDYLYANEIIADYMDDADKYFYGEWVITDSTTTPVTWAPKGNVPVMTSNTAPYGEAFADSVLPQYGDWSAYHAFDKSDSESAQWVSNSFTNAHIGYKFTNPIIARRMVYRPIVADNKRDPKNCKIQASNDGSTWNDIFSFIGEQHDTSTRPIYTIDFDNDIPYLYWRLLIVDSYGGTAQNSQPAVFELQFYGRELSVSVPTMATNTTPFGEVIGTSGTSGYETYKAFDKSNSTKYAAQSGVANNYIGYSFVGKIKPMMAYVYIECAATSNKDFKIQGLNDDTWEDLADFVVPAISSVVSKMFVLDIASDTVYSALRLFSTQPFNISGQYANNIIEIGFYGLDYSEKEFEEGVTKKWLYDHGVELETLTTPNGGVTFGSNQLEISASAANTNYSLDANLDLTDYDLVRFKIGDKYIPTNLEARVNTTEILSWGQSSIAALAASIATNYPNFGLDISAVNGTYYLLWFTNTNSGTPITLKELWLE